ncbi:MAG: O-antigen ligase family protein [Oscillospiraceae bacterium]|jgi:O-antigen ligase|nr:O-antigen ligase family protein [Oscillospiraceae bacterium]
MQKILQSSFIYRILAAAGLWFGGQWRESRLLGRFLRPAGGGRASEGSIFARAWAAAHRALCFVFQKLRLTKLLEGSIFRKPHVWCFLTVTLAPLVPTMAALALALATFGSLLLSFGCQPGKKLAFAPANRYILLYALAYVVSIFTSVTVSGSLKGGLLQTLFILFALAAQNAVTSRRQLDAVLYAFAVSGALVALYGVYQYLAGVTGASAWVDSKMFQSIGTRGYSTLETPHVLSEYRLLVIPFAAAAALAARRAIVKLFFFGCLGVSALCMVLTFSRGGWLGLIICAAVFLVMLDRRFILVGILGLVALYFLLPQTILARFTSIGDLTDSSSSYRLSIWLGTIAMLGDYWFAGIGPGTAAFNKIYPIYSYSSAAAQHSHNLFLQIMCDAGLCGLVLFAVILFSHLRRLASAVSREKDQISRLYQIAAIASVCGFLVQSAADYTFYNYRVTLVFWATLGLGAVIARRSALPEKEDAG